MRLATIFFLVLPLCAAAQNLPARFFTGKALNVLQTGGTSTTSEVSFNFLDETGRYSGADLAVGDMLYVSDGLNGISFPITSILEPGFISVKVVVANVLGAYIPSGSGIVTRGTPNYMFLPFTSGSFQENQVLTEDFVWRVDSLLSIVPPAQTLSLSGQTLSLSGGSSVTLPVIGVAAGAGISVSSSAGVYTVTNTGDTNASDDVSGSGVAGQVAFWDGTKLLAGENPLWWDKTTDWLGVGTSTPLATVHVSGDILVKGPTTPSLTIDRQSGWDSYPLQFFQGGSVESRFRTTGTRNIWEIQGANSIEITSGLNNSKSVLIQSSGLKLQSGDSPYPYYFEFGNNGYSPSGQDASLQSDLNMQFRSQYGHIQWPVNHTEIGPSGAYWQMGRGSGNSDKWAIRIQQAGANSFSDALTLTSTGSAAGKAFQYMGVGTASPSERLDVAGKLKVQDLTATGINLVGSTASGVLTNLGLTGGTISGGSLVIPSLPSGTNTQTLYYSGTTLTPTSNLTHNGTNVALNATLGTAKLSVGGRANGICGLFAAGTLAAGESGISVTGSGTNAAYTVKGDYTITGSNAIFLHRNGATSNALSGALGLISVGSPSAGDPSIAFAVEGGGDSWAVGTDNSNADAFTISADPSLGTADRVIIRTSGEIGFTTTAPTDLSVAWGLTKPLGLPSHTTANRSTSAIAAIGANTDINRIEAKTPTGIFKTIFSDATPSVAAQGAAGSGATATLSVTSNDKAGQITLNTGASGLSAGPLVQVSFSASHLGSIFVNISARNAAAEGRGFVGSQGSTAFTIDFGTAPAASTTYIFNYSVNQ